MNRHSLIQGMGKVLCYALSAMLIVASTASAYDVNGDGKEGLPEAVHSLQVSAGLIPASSTIVYVGAAGTALENGTALRNTLDSITDAGSTRPYLLKIEPGIYDLGNSALYLKAYVDLEGSGQNTTFITSTHSGSSADAGSATVVGFSMSEIRFLTIENRGGGSNSLAMYNSFAPTSLMQVTLRAQGSLHNRGIYNANSAAPMVDVTIIVSGGNTAYGVYNTSSSPIMSRVNIQATNGSLASVGVVNGNSSSPVMSDVTILATDGSSATTGIDNSTTSSPQLFKVTAIVSGSGQVRGINNYNYSSPDMSMVKLDVSGGLSCGVYNDYNCAPKIVGLTVTGPTYGVTNSNASAPIIRDSAISGTSWSLNNQTGTTTKVANTMLSGGVTGTGYTCVGVYNQTFTALGTTCN